MSYLNVKFIFAIFGIAIILAATPVSAQDMRDFRIPEGLISDFTGTLTEAEIDEITAALEGAYKSNSMDGHVIIALRTEEWYLEEYVKDYADYLQGQGKMSPAGWLLYISTADHKFAFTPQRIAADSITQAHRAEISLILNQKLQEGDIAGAVLDAVKAAGALQSPEAIRDERKISPDMLIFMGIMIMVIALMMRLRMYKRREAAG